MDIHYFTVSQANSYLSDLIEEEPVLSQVWISGEVSSLKQYALGQQLYFTLKDEDAQLSCVMYSTAVSRLKQTFQNGDHLFIKGKLSYLRKKGQLLFQVVAVQKKGVGTLSEQLEKLKEKCLKEGLFDPAAKQKIPEFPQNIAVITAPGSAAQIDFLTCIKNGGSHLNITVFSTIMQGLNSPLSLCDALEEIDKREFDCCVICRGGGSMEDLWGFNDETLIRTIFNCKTPVISAIGHEIDYTLTDFVADFRYPTPTAAGLGIAAPFIHLRETIQKQLMDHKEMLDDQVASLFQDTEDMLLLAQSALNTQMGACDTAFSALLHRVKLANPLHKLKQGYSIARLKSSSKIVSKRDEISTGDILEITVQDGQFSAQCL